MGQQTDTAYLSTGQAELRHEHGRLNSLTGIRAFAACWVVAFHFMDQMFGLFPGLEFLSPLVRSGYLGVDLFFGLSGFILAYNYLHRLGENGTWNDRLRFLWLRLARVWPVQFFTLNVALLMMLVARTFGVTINHSQLTVRYTPAAYLENLSLTHDWLGRDMSFNGPSWSVSAEWFAYLLFPLLVVVVVRVRSLWGAWVGAIACYATLGAATFAMNVGLETSTIPSGLRVVLEFTAGCFLFRVSERTGRGVAWKWLAPMSVAGILIGAVTVGSTSHGVVLAPLFGLLILSLAKTQGLLVRALSTRVLVFGCEVSFALYMTHFLVQQLAGKMLPIERFADSGWVVRGAVFACYLVMFSVAAVATHLLVEKPARNRMRSVRVFATPA